VGGVEGVGGALEGVVADRAGGWVRHRARYAAGLLDGESLRFGDPGAPLFALDPGLRPALERGVLAPLRPAFERHGLRLSDEALILVDDPGVEWRIAQAEGMLTIRREGNDLPVYPGRVVERTLYAGGEVLQRATYEGGRLHGRSITCRAPAPGDAPLFALPARGALETGDLKPLGPAFQKEGHQLREGATVSAIEDGREWFVAQEGQTFGLRLAPGAPGAPAAQGGELLVYPGRVVSHSTFSEGRLDGETALYDEGGWLTQTINLRQGLLEGPLVVYGNGRRLTASEYREGRLHGQLVTYDDHGQPATVATYVEGQQSGPLRLVEQGAPRVVSAYQEGQPHGQTVVYQPNGKEVLVAAYAQGRLEGERVIYSEDGRPLQRAEYAGGKLHGQTVDYYPSGPVRQVSHYAQDQLDGPLYVYDPEGRLTEERHYQAGTLVQQRQRESWLSRLWQT
jgi:antitoxin component YwqK of YwqJK toxin-antitoxin module